MVEQWPPGEPAGLQLSAVDLPCKWRCLGAPCPAQVWLKMCRGVLAARSVSDVSRVWHAHKLQSPLVCSVLQATQGLRVWWYNLQRPAAPASTVQVPLMVRPPLHTLATDFRR